LRSVILKATVPVVAVTMVVEMLAELASGVAIAVEAPVIVVVVLAMPAVWLVVAGPLVKF